MFIMPASLYIILMLAIYCTIGMVLYHILPSILTFFAYLIGGGILLCLIWHIGSTVDKKEAAKKAALKAKIEAEKKAEEERQKKAKEEAIAAAEQARYDAAVAEAKKARGNSDAAFDNMFKQ